jgi:hypothetical protein
MADQNEAFQYISLDPGGEVIRLRLPPGHEHYRSELLEELAEEFSFEPRGAQTEQRMNEYVRAWLDRRQQGTAGRGER